MSGEAATGAQQAAFQLGGRFLNVMLAPFVDGRCGIGGSGRQPLGDPPDCDEVQPSAPRLFQGASDVHQGAAADAAGL